MYVGNLYVSRFLFSPVCDHFITSWIPPGGRTQSVTWHFEFCKTSCLIKMQKLQNEVISTKRSLYCPYPSRILQLFDSLLWILTNTLRLTKHQFLGSGKLCPTSTHYTQTCERTEVNQPPLSPPVQRQYQPRGYTSFIVLPQWILTT